MLELDAFPLKAQGFSLPQSPATNQDYSTQQWFSHVCGGAGWFPSDAQEHCALVEDGKWKMNIVLNLNSESRQKVIIGAGAPPGEVGE